MFGIKRREFITLLGGAAAAWPIAARAQQGERVRRVGVLHGYTTSDPEWQRRAAAFRRGLQELGWAEGRNVAFEMRSAAGHLERLPVLAAELVRMNVDVIITQGTEPTEAALKATRNIPIVMASIGDAVGAGIIASLARPGGNVTGLTLVATEQASKRLELLKDILPSLSRVSAPTPYVWVLGRTKTDGPTDYDAVHKIQAGYKVTPLSQWGKPPVPPTVTIDPAVDMKTPPKVQVDTMPADKFFAYSAELLKANPPHITDEPMIAQLKKIGIEVGKSFDMTKADPAVRKALATAPEEARQLMAWKVPTLARVANGWSMNTDTMGVYGNYYLKRAIVSQLGLGANLPEDAIYPLNLADETGRPLDGANKYRLHFEKGETPPANAFWSVTLYDAEGFQVANPLNRFNLSSWMPLKYNADGSLDLYFQNGSPGADKEANWLPAPKDAFNLLMRLYAPRSDVLTGKWNPPPVTRVSLPSIGGQ
jgi:hypothetical protein